MLDFLRYIPLAQLGEPGGPTGPGGGGGGGSAFTIDLPIDLASVATAIGLVGGSMLLLFAGLFIGFRLVKRFVRRLAVSVDGGSGAGPNSLRGDPRHDRMLALRRAVRFVSGDTDEPVSDYEMYRYHDLIDAQGGLDAANDALSHYDFGRE